MLGQYLKDYRLARNLTQKQMCKIIGISYVYYSNIETGKHKPSYVVIDKISKAVNEDVTFIRSLL